MKVKQVRTEPGDVLLVPGDMHFDVQDQGAINVMLKVAKAAGVNSVDLVGDTFESAGISRHKGLRAARKFRVNNATIKAEAKAARPVLQALRDQVEEVRLQGSQNSRPGGLHVLTGNHEHWWKLVQDDYPGLLDTHWFELYGDIFDGWHVHEEYVALKHGPLLVCHGHRLRGALNKFSAATVLGRYPGQNTLYGHTHRLDGYTAPTFKYGVAVSHGAWTMGHLKDRDEEIMDAEIGPNAETHQQGFALVHFFERGKDELGFDVQLVRIHRDDQDRPLVVWNGEVYR